jgi:hypothetical protein
MIQAEGRVVLFVLFPPDQIPSSRKAYDEEL